MELFNLNENLNSERCPNLQPTVTGLNYRIAIIGEAPGETELKLKQPFSGPSGNFLNALLGKVGILRNACFVGNVCQLRPPGNDISKFDFDGFEITDGLAELRSDLKEFNPNICLLLGATALRAAKGEEVSITAHRGSLFTGGVGTAFEGYKCLATYHPAACLRMYDWTPILAFDLKRAMEESRSSELILPTRTLRTGMSFDDTYSHLQNLNPGQLHGFDIEGWCKTGATAIAFASDPLYAFCVPFEGTYDGSYWTADQEEAIWREMSHQLKQGPKLVMQGGVYDQFVLHFTHKMHCHNWTDDSMLAWAELYSELPKGLGFLASVLSKEPYYKSERRAADLNTYWRYNAKDAAVTLEVFKKTWDKLPVDGREHYRFNMRLTKVVAYMMLRGTRFDANRRQFLLNECAMARKEQETILQTQFGIDLNVKSWKQKQDLLYNKLALPIQRKRGEKGKEGKITTDYEALIKLRHSTGKPELTPIIHLVQIRTRESQLNSLGVDNDNRIRCTFKVCGTETMRFSSSESPSGSGTNLQTMPGPQEDSEVPVLKKGMRSCFVADEGFEFFQADLSGADGWTVAAHCLRLGYPRMWEDYCNGLKPAKILVLMLEHGAVVNDWSVEKLREFCRLVKKEDWRYFAMKQVQHGSNYGMKERTLQARIFIESGGKIWVQLKDIAKFQSLYFTRYNGVSAWQQWVARQLMEFGRMKSASGHTRIFMGRRGDHDTNKQGYANEPQENTSYACNLALLRMYEDGDNRDANNGLLIQPLLQVHDAVCGQYPTSSRDWAHGKIKSYFDNRIVIAGKELVIPYEANYGQNWEELTGEIK